MYAFHHFVSLPIDWQITQLSKHGIALDLASDMDSAEGVLFAYHDFYIELIVQKFSDEIVAVRCFKSIKKLEPYLHQINISEITALLICSK